MGEMSPAHWLIVIAIAVELFGVRVCLMPHAPSGAPRGS
jgi:hypothetical protein